MARRNFTPGRLAAYIVLIVWCILAIFPIFWMASTSFKPVTEGFGGLGSLLPQNPTLNNYVAVSRLLPLARNILNSVTVATVGTILTVFLCSLAGMAFAKYEFPGKNALFFLLLATMMVPPEAGVVPVFAIMRALGWINNLLSLIIPTAATAIGIFYMRQYISGFPNEVMEQAVPRRVRRVPHLLADRRAGCGAGAGGVGVHRLHRPLERLLLAADLHAL